MLRTWQQVLLQMAHVTLPTTAWAVAAISLLAIPGDEWPKGPLFIFGVM